MLNPTDPHLDASKLDEIQKWITLPLLVDMPCGTPTINQDIPTDHRWIDIQCDKDVKKEWEMYEEYKKAKKGSYDADVATALRLRAAARQLMVTGLNRSGHLEEKDDDCDTSED